MTSYSFGETSAALMDGASGSSAASGPYDSNRAYRRDSAIAGAHMALGACDYHSHKHSPVQAMCSKTSAGLGGGLAPGAVAASMAGSDVHMADGSAFADYLIKQQEQTSSDISSVVAAVAAGHTSVGCGASSSMAIFHNSPLLHSPVYAPRAPFSGYGARYQNQQHYQEPVAAATTTTAASSNNQSPSAGNAALPDSSSSSGVVSLAATAEVSLAATPLQSSAALSAHESAGSTPSSSSSSSASSCLIDPLPGFLSSLPLPTPMESSKYSSMVAGIASSNHSGAAILAVGPNGSAGAAMTGSFIAGANSTSNSLLAAAAAAAAAAVVGTTSASSSALSSANQSASLHSGSTTFASLTPTAGSHQHYSGQHSHSYTHSHSHSHQHSHGYNQSHQGAYDVSSLGLSHDSAMATVAGTPAIPGQTVSGIGAAALAQGSGSVGGNASGGSLDLNSYSISAFSRPMSQASATAAVMLSSDAGSGAVAGGGGGSGSFGSVGQVSSSVMSLAQQQSQQPNPYTHSSYQQRSYSDYAAYYRSPSTTMGLGTGSTSATGASPMSGTGINAAAAAAAAAGNTATGNATQMAAAAAAAAAAMGGGYYASAYQPYMRPSVTSGAGGGGVGGVSGGAPGGAHAYYYAPQQSRYLPYSAYPPIRHFVSPARPFKCETCDQSFSRNHDLKRHVKIHSGVKPHKCPKCGKSFGRSDALKRHSMVKRCRSTNSGGSKAAPASAQAPGAMSSGAAASLQRQQMAPPRLDPTTSGSVRMPLQQQHQPHSMLQQGAAGAMLTSVPSSSRLAPVGSMFGPGGGGSPSAMSVAAAAAAAAAATNSIVSSMLTSRTNSI
ncbi:hypothetical protein H4R26_004091 [Coemansia thaxteri]|uniref:C2H2-type domain-containing protein n=1 Tax=Coemansia thaxteri TaxID=2663907 RepID=A0A9W8BGT8_9FUNG|nr:hypothetical protein H4R26_004091 [Coemansia thaxteri]KAJ2479413.1 hypothetical protein EV174_004032 [Coemansia sp. RSA 2320]